jgi:hypothetical protein
MCDDNKKMRWRYGDAWEKHPIQESEIWIEIKSQSRIAVADITKRLPSFMKTADMIYCDPPWNLGNANSFNTKAGIGYYHESFSAFYDRLFQCVREINPHICYLEIGAHNKEIFKTELGRIFPIIQEWEIRYYRKNKCFLLRGGKRQQDFDFTGFDDSKTTELAIKYEYCKIIGDLCVGRGLTFVAAYKNEKRFVGTELNQRRLAVAIERITKLGGKFESTIP